MRTAFITTQPKIVFKDKGELIIDLRDFIYKPRKICKKRAKRMLLTIITVFFFLTADFYVNAQTTTKITAHVSGWFETERRDNESLDIKTNMQVYVNGHKFENCTNIKTANLNDLQF